jgi:hypothetical protein
MSNLHTRRTANGSPLFLVGKDSQGHWVARDQSGLCGGIFVGRAEALKFAMAENGNCPQAVVMVPGVLELDLSVTPPGGRRSADPAAAADQPAVRKQSARRSRRKAAA